MPAPRTLGAFRDVKSVLDAAVASGGGTYRLKSPGAAIKWRQRAYQFRKLLLDIAERNDLLKLSPASTPYDALTLSLDGPCVIIKLNDPVGEFIPADGTEAVNLNKIEKEAEENEFSAAAERLARELRGGLASPPAIDLDPEEPAGD